MSATNPEFRAGLAAMEQTTSLGSFESLKVYIAAQNVAVLELARPTKSNALDIPMWTELPKVRQTDALESWTHMAEMSSAFGFGAQKAK